MLKNYYLQYSNIDNSMITGFRCKQSIIIWVFTSVVGIYIFTINIFTVYSYLGHGSITYLTLIYITERVVQQSFVQSNFSLVRLNDHIYFFFFLFCLDLFTSVPRNFFNCNLKLDLLSQICIFGSLFHSFAPRQNGLRLQNSDLGLLRVKHGRKSFLVLGF